MTEGDLDKKVWDGEGDHDIPEPKEAPMPPTKDMGPSDEPSEDKKTEEEPVPEEEEPPMEEPSGSDFSSPPQSSGSDIGMWAMISGIVALVLGLLQLPGAFLGACGCCFGFFGLIAAIAAIVMGIISLSDENSKGKGKLGIIFGIGYFVLVVISIILMIVLTILWNIATFSF